MSALANCTSPKTPTNVHVYVNLLNFFTRAAKPHQEQEEALRIAARDANPTCRDDISKLLLSSSWHAY